MAQSTSLEPTRPTVTLRPEEDQVVDEVISALCQEKDLFQRDGALVRAVTSEPPRTSIARASWGIRIEPIPQPALREMVTRWVRLVRHTEEGEKECHPPHWLVPALAARGGWSGVRYLVGVVSEPVLTPDGSVLQEAGYDASSGLLYLPRHERAAIEPLPSLDDAKYAAESLLEVVCDFPFEGSEHRSAFLAGLLTPFARFAFRGPAPLFIIDANTPGTGKSLLADVIGLITSGRRMPRMAHVQSDEETRKVITSIARDGSRLFLIDNVAGPLGCASLDAALTSTTWRDRILGKSQLTGELTLLATFYATGNNIVLGGDTHRRTVHIRIETDRERPEERGDFTHRELLRWVESKRYAFARDAVTILRAYHVAGRPDVPMTPWGSFEDWSRHVRAPLIWLGLPDPYCTRSSLAEATDHEGDLARRVFGFLEDLDPGRCGLTVNEVRARLQRNDHAEHKAALVEWVGRADREGLPNPRSLGMKLRHHRNRIVSGKMLLKMGERWKVVEAGSGDSGGSRTARSATSGAEEEP